MTARRTGATLAALVALTCLGVAVGQDIATHGRLGDLSPADCGAAVSFTAVGIFLLLRGKVRPVAVILTVQGTTAALTVLSSEVVDNALRQGPLHGATLWLAWLGNLVWLPGVILLVPLVLLFPDGRLLGPVWRWPIRLAVGCGVVFALGAILPTHSLEDNAPDASWAPNPTAIVDLHGAGTTALTVVSDLIVPCLGASLLVAVVGVVARRRRAVGVERAQLTCLLYGAGVTASLLIFSFALPENAWWQWAIACLGLFPIAVAVSVAVLRYRLYEIDRVVSRTVTYVLVLAVLVGIYVGVLAGLAALIPTRYGQVGVAAATLTVAALAVPLTRRVRRWVDHRFNRRRYDAERVVTAFATRLRARPDHGDVPSELLEVLQRTVQPSHAAVWTVGR